MLRHLALAILLTLCVGFVVAQLPVDAGPDKPATIELEKNSDVEGTDDLQADASHWGYGGGRGYYGGGYGGQGYGGWGGRGNGDWGGRGYGWGGRGWGGRGWGGQGWGGRGWGGGWGGGWSGRGWNWG